MCTAYKNFICISSPVSFHLFVNNDMCKQRVFRASAFSCRLTNRSERKSANSFRKSVYGPSGLYTVARSRDRTDLFSISDSVTLSISILNELDLYPVF